MCLKCHDLILSPQFTRLTGEKLTKDNESEKERNQWVMLAWMLLLLPNHTSLSSTTILCSLLIHPSCSLCLFPHYPLPSSWIWSPFLTHHLCNPFMHLSSSSSFLQETCWTFQFVLLLYPISSSSSYTLSKQIFFKWWTVWQSEYHNVK